MKPFVLRNAGQIRPEPPYFAYSDGIVLPNERLKPGKLLSFLADAPQAQRFAERWSQNPMVRWNEIARVIAAEGAPDLRGRTRLFAQITTTLADATLRNWEMPINPTG